MDSGARQHGSDSTTSLAALPPDILRIICSFMTDPDDVAACHMVDTRFCHAARAALHSAVPQDPGFIELALRHRYSLRHLSTAELPFCELGSYLGKAPGSLTSLDVVRYTLFQPRSDWRQPSNVMYMADVLQGICSLRVLSCPVTDQERTLDFLQPHLAGLHSLSLDCSRYTHDFQGLLNLTSLTRLAFTTSLQSGPVYPQLLSVITELTTLQSLRLHALADASPLSVLSRLTALRMGVRSMGCCSRDEDIQTLVEALPQLRALDLLKFGESATEAGYRQLAKLSKLHHLRLVDAFPDGAQYGTNAGVATMTGLEALGISCRAFPSAQVLAGFIRLTRLTALHLDMSKLHRHVDTTTTASAVDVMLAAVGARLQRLQICGKNCGRRYNLLPSILTRCPLLTHLDADTARPGDADVASPADDVSQGSISPLWEADNVALMTCCSHLHLRCRIPEALLATPRFVELRRLSLHLAPVSLDDYMVTDILKGLQCLAHLQYLTVQTDTPWTSGPLLSMLEALASCSMLEWLQVADELSEYDRHKGPLVCGMEHLRALTKLPKLAVLNLYDVPWAEDIFCTGLTLLAAALPRLRVLNAPTEVLLLHRVQRNMIQLTKCLYELRDLPGRWLRLWPRRATLDDDMFDPASCLWPVLEPQRWLWDE